MEVLSCKSLINSLLLLLSLPNSELLLPHNATFITYKGPHETADVSDKEKIRQIIEKYNINVGKVID